MTISFEAEPDDYLAYLNHLNFHTELGKAAARRALVFRFVVAVLGGLLIQALIGFGANAWPWVGLTITLLMGLAIWLGRHALRRNDIRRVYAQWKKSEAGQQLAGTRTATVDADGLRWQSPSGEHRVPFASLTDVATTKDHLFVTWAHSMVFVIPSRAFATETAFLRFGETLRDGRAGAIAPNAAVASASPASRTGSWWTRGAAGIDGADSESQPQRRP